MAAPPLVCIISQDSRHLVEEERLTAAGVRVRHGTSSPGCDLLFSKAGVTLAFLLLSPVDEGAVAAAEGRVQQLSKGFKRAFVLLAYEALAGTPLLAAQFGAEPNLSFVTMPLCANFTAQTLAIAQAVMAGAAEERGWVQQQEQVVTTAEAVAQVLLGLPLPSGTDRGHQINMLRMLGSIQQLSQLSIAHIIAHTDLPPPAAQQVAAFFRRGAGVARQPSLPVDQAGARAMPVMRSL